MLGQPTQMRNRSSIFVIRLLVLYTIAKRTRRVYTKINVTAVPQMEHDKCALLARISEHVLWILSANVGATKAELVLVSRKTRSSFRIRRTTTYQEIALGEDTW